MAQHHRVYDSPVSDSISLTPVVPWIKMLQGFVSLKDDLYPSRVRGSRCLNDNCKSPPQPAHWPYPLPGLTSHFHTSHTKGHMSDFLPCSCCYLRPRCLPLAYSSHLLKLNSTHCFLEVSPDPSAQRLGTSFSWHCGGSRPISHLKEHRGRRERFKLSSVATTIKKSQEVS